MKYVSDEDTNTVLNYRHPDGSTGTLSWAFDDEDARTEITIFDLRTETKTRWITMDAAHVCDLTDSV